jgi:hypothetical protein
VLDYRPGCANPRPASLVVRGTNPIATPHDQIVSMARLDQPCYHEHIPPKP